MIVGWRKASFGELVRTVSVRGHQVKSSDYADSGLYPIIDQGQKKIVGYTDKPISIKGPFPLTLFGDHTRIVKLTTSPFVVGADGVKLLYPRKTDVDPKYLFFLTELAVESIPNLGYSRHFRELKKVIVVVPPLLEQCRVAKILSTWVEAIEKIEKLITVAKVRQNGFIRELLPNKHWPEMFLGEIGDISSAGVDKKTKAGENPVRLLNYLDVLNKDYISDSDLNHWVTAPDRQIASCDIQKGDVFFTPSSEIRNDIAHSAVATEDINGAVYSYHVVRFRLHEPWDLNFRAYAFKSPCFYRQAYQLCEGSGQRYVLSQKMFRQMTVRVPPIKTQRIIGAILRTIDEEIAGLRIIATVLRKEKKALMQQLLTGKRRVETGNSK